jgi:hypothetical protein
VSVLSLSGWDFFFRGAVAFRALFIGRPTLRCFLAAAEALSPEQRGQK